MRRKGTRVSRANNILKLKIRIVYCGLYNRVGIPFFQTILAFHLRDPLASKNVDKDRDIIFAGFCKGSVFSLSTKYNHGTLPCHCDIEGSSSFECEKFGGQCPCRENVVGRRCDSCKTGYFGFPSCQPCNCSTTAICDTTSGM